MKRLRIPLIAIAWLCIAGWYWTYLPPIGHVLARADDPRDTLRIEAFDASGRIVVSRLRHVGGGTYKSVGPLTVHDPTNGEIVRSVLSIDDRPISTHWTGTLAIARGNQTIKLVSLTDGRTLIECPIAKGTPYRAGELSPSGKRFFAVAPEGLTMWDVAERRKLWVVERIRSAEFGDDDIVQAARWRAPDFKYTEYVRLDAATGDVVPGPPPIVYDCGSGVRSPNGEYVATLGGIYDYATSQKLWAFERRVLKGEVLPFEGPPVRFNEDSSEVWLVYSTGEHAMAEVRWRTEDGRPTTPYPDETRPAQGLWGIVTADGRWSVKRHSQSPSWLLERVPKSILAWMYAWHPRVTQAVSPGPCLAVVDNRRDRIAAVIPNVGMSFRRSPDGQALLIDNQSEIVRYRLPVERDVLWLCLWGVAPAAMMMGIAVWRRRSLLCESKPTNSVLRAWERRARDRGVS